MPNILVFDIRINDVEPEEKSRGSWVCGQRKMVVVISKIEHHGQTQISLVAHASRRLRCVFSASKNWEKDRGEYRDDGDDNKKFDEGEGTPLHPNENDVRCRHLGEGLFVGLVP